MGKQMKSDKRIPNQAGSILMGDLSTMELDLAEDISKKTSGFIQSSNHRDLLDIVDSLRSSGVSH